MIQELSVFEHHPLSVMLEAGGWTREAGRRRRDAGGRRKSGSLEVWNIMLRASGFPLISGFGKL